MVAIAFRRGMLLSLAFASLVVCSFGWNPKATAKEPATKAKPVAIDGEELFGREWLPGDTRSHAGDGLGPVFNETSCVACHNQGGVGGGGANSKNVTLVTAFANDPEAVEGFRQPPSFFGGLVRSMFGVGGSTRAVPKQSEEETEKLVEKQRAALAKIHPGFLSARSVVLHRGGTHEKYDAWRAQLSGLSNLTGEFGMFEATSVFDSPDTDAPTLEVAEATPIEVETAEVQAAEPTVVGEGVAQAPPVATAAPFSVSAPSRRGGSAAMERARMEAQMSRGEFGFMQGQVGKFIFLSSQRNTPPLFGAGQLDAVPVALMKQQAARQRKAFPEVSGRIAKLKDGRIGRFGWKAQEASLEDFVLTACAVELGLHVPGHDQTAPPHDVNYKPAGHDLTKAECIAMIDYIRELPMPAQRAPATDVEAKYLAEGERLFAKTGCAACHTPDMGPAVGVYSDLLVHDMGPELGDSASYSGFAPNSTEEEELKRPLPNLAGGFDAQRPTTTKVDESKLVGATRQEWRTPPLWGVRDSAPYLHDGRAATLEQAIALHGGEGEKSARRFFNLGAKERMQVVAFLKSLSATTTVASK